MDHLLDSVNNIDQLILLAVNRATGNPVLDTIMVLFSSKMIWVPLYGFLGFRIFKAFGTNVLGWTILAVGCLVVITDQGSVLFFKDTIQRLRPCHEPDLNGMLNLTGGNCGGQYGFISSHAANVFGIATVIGRMFVRNSGWWNLIFVWAGAVSFSRVYLAVHYPSDILVGGLFGVVVGYCLMSVLKRIL